MSNQKQKARRERALNRLSNDKRYYEAVQQRFDSGDITDSYLVNFFSFIPKQLSRIFKEIATLKERIGNG